MQAQLPACREWSEKHASSDLNSDRDILVLLELGRAKLKFNLIDFVDLRNFHSDTLEWHQTTSALLSGPKSKEHNVEFLAAHLEMASNLDITDPSYELLVTVRDMALQFKQVAQKVLQSRPLCRLEAHAS